jgi:pimeloyl-ACP methyl ester carboxylesterase
MQRLPLRRLAAIALALSAVAIVPRAGRAQLPEPQRIGFESCDKVMLRGTFYPTAKNGATSPAVILLHKLGADRSQPGFDSLAKKLQEKGFSVLTFDFRGHGDSTDVGENFWKQPHNVSYIKGANAKKQSIDFKEFTRTYYPVLVDDIVAAKHAMELKNNAKECNAADTIIIAEDDACALAALYATSEWQRRRIIQGPMGFPVQGEPEGRDIAAVVMLSPRNSMGSGQNIITGRMGTWLKDPKVREKIGWFVVHGEQDGPGKKEANYIYNDLLQASKLKNKPVFLGEIKETKLSGAELLRKNLPTEEWVVKFLDDKIRESRSNTVWAERDMKNYYPMHVPLIQFGYSIR